MAKHGRCMPLASAPALADFGAFALGPTDDVAHAPTTSRDRPRARSCAATASRISMPGCPFCNIQILQPNLFARSCGRMTH
eukprot:7757932-Pyramimonas_sp.AAC.1